MKMSLAKLLLVILPAAVLAEIHVDLTGTFDPSKPDLKVSFSGSDKHVISDKEIETFKLSRDNLKKGVKLYFGKEAQDMYLRSPTPWGDLYKTYNWEEVSRMLKPINAKILKTNSERQVILQKEIKNVTPNKISKNVDISQSVENIMSSSWSKNGELNVDKNTEYKFEIDFLNSKRRVSMSYPYTWGSNAQQKQKVNIGSSSVKLDLEPNQAVKAELEVLKVTVDIQVEYQARLTGNVAVNYVPSYKGHHFWNLDVNGVMSAAQLKNDVKSSEVIKVTFYGSPRVVIRDIANSNKNWEISV